jgi:hypothetical protein
MHHSRDQREAKTLTDAGWALRLRADQQAYQGEVSDVAYSVCAVLDRAAADVAHLTPGMRSDMLLLCEAIARSAKHRASV